MKRRISRSIILAFLAIFLTGILGFVIWGSTPSGPSGEALSALKSDSTVQVVETSQWIVFSPSGVSAQTGLVFYPGGHVDYRAYAPLLRPLAARGYLVVLPRMPLNLAVLDPARAGRILADFPWIKHWAVGGHSLGGSMAANYAYTHPDKVKGLLLWASYPASSNSLYDHNLKVLSIYGSLDGLATPQKIMASRTLLPPSTRWLAIDGGDHAQFGSYGPQPGDHPAAISPEAQRNAVVDASDEFLAALAE